MGIWFYDDTPDDMERQARKAGGLTMGCTIHGRSIVLRSQIEKYAVPTNCWACFPPEKENAS